MVAVSERLRSLLPGHRTEITPREHARHVIHDAIQRVQRGRSEAARLIRETDGSDVCQVFTDPKIDIPKPDAYGILDLHGRIPGYHSKPTQLGPDLRVFTHPSVGMTYPKVVFEAVEKLDPESGRRSFVEVWAKRRTPWHDALLEGEGTASKGLNHPRFPTVNPVKTIEERLKIPY